VIQVYDPKGGEARGKVPDILGPHSEFKADVGYTVSSKPTWTTE
jgi:hypothetical protein